MNIAAFLEIDGGGRAGSLIWAPPPSERAAFSRVRKRAARAEVHAHELRRRARPALPRGPRRVGAALIYLKCLLAFSERRPSLLR